MDERASCAESGSSEKAVTAKREKKLVGLSKRRRIDYSAHNIRFHSDSQNLPPGLVEVTNDAELILQGVPRLVSQVTLPFSRTYIGGAGCPFTWWTRIVSDLIFWKKFWNLFFLSWSGPGTSSAWFSGSVRLLQVCSKFKRKFSAVIQLFGLKITSHGKLD